METRLGRVLLATPHIPSNIAHGVVMVTKSRRLRWEGYVARMEEGRSAFKILTGAPTGKRHLGIPRRRLDDNIIMCLKEIGVNARN